MGRADLRADVYGTAEAAELVGLHRAVLARAVRAGLLRARRAPHRRGRPAGRFEFTRAELVRFLLGRGADPAAVRRLLARADAVALVRTPAAVQAALGRLVPTVQCDSLFDLGRLVEGRKVWAAVLALPELGTADTARALRAFHAQPDRPELVALVGEDGVGSLPSPVPFDVLIGAGTSPAAVAAAVVRLRGG